MAQERTVLKQMIGLEEIDNIQTGTSCNALERGKASSVPYSSR